MEFRCGAVLAEELVRRLVAGTPGDLAARFERSLEESWVDDNARVKWCPSAPHCGHAVQARAASRVAPSQARADRWGGRSARPIPRR